MSSMEVLDQIKDAEKQAEDIRRQAAQDARNIIGNAQDQAEKLADELLRKTIEAGKNLMDETEAETLKEIESIKQKNDAKISALKTGAENNLDEAVSFVLGRIVKDYGRN